MKKYNSFQINIIQNYGSIFENYNDSWLNNQINQIKEQPKEYYHQFIKLYNKGDIRANIFLNYMIYKKNNDFFIKLINNDIEEDISLNI